MDNWTSARSKCTTNIWQNIDIYHIDNMHLYKCSCCINFHFQILKVGFNTKNCPTLTPTKDSPRSSVHLLVIFMKLFQLLLQGHSSAREVGNTLMGSEIWEFAVFAVCHGLQVFGSSESSLILGEKSRNLRDHVKNTSILQNQINQGNFKGT